MRFDKRLLDLSVALIVIAIIMASCKGSDTASSSATTLNTVATATYTDIVINEVQSTATTSYLQSDFVELYNTSSATYTFSAGEWYLTDSEGAATHICYIPGGTTIAGSGYLTLLPDETSVPSDAPAGSIACANDGVNINFGLGSSDAVYLFNIGSSNPTPTTAVDNTSWTAHVKTRARIPDGGTWSAIDSRAPSPGAANVESSTKLITAFSFTSPAASGVIDQDGRTIAVTVPYGTSVTALVATFTFTGSSAATGTVVQTSGVSVNDFTTTVTYTVTAEDGSTADYAVTVTVAAYSSNIVINEVQSNPTTSYLTSDFVELYNTSAATYTFAAGEWYITDSGGAASDICYIPGGTEIAGYGYLVLLPNDTSAPADAPAGSIACSADGTNTSFGLGSSDSVSLYFIGIANPSPSAAIDSTSWTSHVKTRARIPDGSAWSASDVHAPTPGATNGN